MGIRLRILSPDEVELLPGDFWRHEEWWGCMWRTPDADLPDRDAWFIVLPNGAGGWTTTDHSSLREPDGHGKGPPWDVTGEAPNISVTPSIDASPEWHGWITNGAFT